VHDLAGSGRGPRVWGFDHDGRISDRVVKIYLLSIDNRRFFFYADESEAVRAEGEGSESSGPAPSGLWGRLRERFVTLKSAWEHSESRVARWTRQSWDWLHSWAHPDEAMLARLRSARQIDLHHPAARHGDEVRALWGDYLAHRWWRHLLWFGTNGLAAIPGLAILWVLPGPNVIGYWFAYRTIHHALIVWGIRRVRRGRVRIELHPLMSLDRPIERGEGGKARHAALDDEAAQLDEHVAWSETESTGVIPDEERPATAARGTSTEARSEEP
jgi:hypothetical protein